MTHSLPESESLWQRPWFGPAVVGATGIAMLIWTWQTWPDVLIDFGVQLYVPWRLASGEVLYRDIAHYTGPLSVYYHAAALAIFGTSLRVLEFVEIPIVALIAAEIYYLAQKLGGKLCGVMCGISFFTMFAFAHLTQAGNYNFICPYEYEYTHATLLCLGAVIFLWRFTENQRRLDALLAGFAAGLVFLTRAEFFVAIGGAAMVAGIISWRNNRSKTLGGIGLFVVSMSVPPIVSTLLLATAMPMRTAITGTLGMWPGLLRGNVASQVFYRHSMGLDDWVGNLWQMFLWAIGYAAIVGILLGFSSGRGRAWRYGLILIGIIGIALLPRVPRTIWPSMFRAIPLTTLIAVGGALWCRRQTPNRRATGSAIFAVFAFLLLGKVFLYTRIIQYGVWLAMPAVMLMIIALLGWIPEYLRNCRANANFFTSCAGVLWSIVILIHLYLTGGQIAGMTVSVGQGGDQFWAAHSPARALLVNDAVDFARQNISSDQTLLCAPEGIMINYLARRRAAVPYVNYNPPDLSLFGEENMVRALEKSPPDVVMIVHKDTGEFGARFFGRDYGQNLGEWIDRNYRELTHFGTEPLVDEHLGIRVMIRNGH